MLLAGRTFEENLQLLSVRPCGRVPFFRTVLVPILPKSVCVSAAMSQRGRRSLFILPSVKLGDRDSHRVKKLFVFLPIGTTFQLIFLALLLLGPPSLGPSAAAGKRIPHPVLFARIKTSALWEP